MADFSILLLHGEWTEMTINSLKSRKAAAAFKSIVDLLGRDDVSGILMNWNDSELSEDGSRIILYLGRDREYSRGAVGGKATVAKAEFLAWLLGDGPFDEKVYGKEIRKDDEWIAKIELARRASGLCQGENQSQGEKTGLDARASYSR